MDARVIEDVRAQRTRRVNDPAEVGGWPVLAPGEPAPDSDRDGMPDAWETLAGFNSRDPADGNADRDGDGYTNLEEFLNATKPNRAD